MATEYIINRQYYLGAWVHAFEAIFGWDIARVQEFCQRWENHLNTGDGMFYHENPMYYVAAEIVDHVEPPIIGARRNRLTREIQFAIENGDINLERNANFDWDSAAKRVELVLKRHNIPMR